jgi:hypothetical protein
MLKRAVILSNNTRSATEAGIAWVMIYVGHRQSGMRWKMAALVEVKFVLSSLIISITSVLFVIDFYLF